MGGGREVMQDERRVGGWVGGWVGEWNILNIFWIHCENILEYFLDLGN